MRARDHGFRLSRTLSLRRAASVVFAAAALLPLLGLVYFLSRAGVLGHPEVRLGLGFALGVSLLGFIGLRRLLGQVTRLARDLQARPTEPVEAGRLEVPARLPALHEITEIAQFGETFGQMLQELRGATVRLEDLVFKLNTLNETVELASRVPKIEDLLGLVLDNTMRAIRATVGSIMILDEPRQTLRLAAARGLPAEAPPDVEVRLGEGVAGRVLELGQPVLVDDIEADPRFARPSAPHYGNGSFICMPIRAGQRVVGVLNMAKRRESSSGASRPEPFSPTELAFLNTLMAYIGHSVENARLLDEARRSAQRLQGVVADLRANQAAAVHRETLRAIGQLSSGVAHHLNNLFAVILGRIELLLRKVREPEMRRPLEVVLRTARDGAEVVRRVQRFSRVDALAGPGAVDLNELAHDVVELTRPRWYDEAQLRGAPIETTLELEPIPPAVGEAAPLREVLMNLVLNAVDALPRGGTIAIRTWADDGRVHCAVMDAGVGMSEAVRQRAVEPFFTTKGPKSLGLGLSVAHGTAERYGGAVAIESTEGRGTRVVLSLPVARPSAGTEAALAAPAVPPMRILVVDDDSRVRTTLADLLEAQGHEVRQASGGREGLRALETGEATDLLLTDLGMPDMTGWEVARLARERWPGLPIGLITGWDAPDLEPEERSRVDFVLSKPFEDGALRRALGALAGRVTRRVP